jgi:hypothetical protein
VNAGVLLFSATGRVRNTNAAPANFNGGTPTAADGKLSWAAAVPTAFLSGLGFTPAGSLSIALGGVIAGHVAGVPVAADGRVCAEVGAVTEYSGGLPITATGRLALDVLNALSGFSDGFDGGFG